MSINSTKKNSVIKTKKRTRYGGTKTKTQTNKTQPNKNSFRYKPYFYKRSKKMKNFIMPPADTTETS